MFQGRHDGAADRPHHPARQRPLSFETFGYWIIRGRHDRLLVAPWLVAPACSIVGPRPRPSSRLIANRELDIFHLPLSPVGASPSYPAAVRDHGTPLPGVSSSGQVSAFGSVLATGGDG